MSETYTSSSLKNSLQILNGRRYYIFLGLFFIALLLPAFWIDVFETTDARYSEIAREMMRSGNWMEPFYNGIKHFHKPPVTYWMTALGMEIFGVNGLGARFFAAVFSVLTLVFTRRTAYVLTGDKDRADASVLILASSILFLVVSRIVATDIYLTFFTVAALYYLFSQIYTAKEPKNALMLALMLGLGFMTKGPIIFLFTLLPFFIVKIFRKDHRKVFSYKDIAAGVLVFLAVSLPWYVYVVMKNDGLFDYFIFKQTVDRVATNTFNRAEPIYFLPLIFLFTFMPYTVSFFRSFKRADLSRAGLFLYLYVLVPFIIFELSESKLASYLMPLYCVSAIIASLSIDRDVYPRVTAYLLMFISLAAAAAVFFVPMTKPHAALIAPAWLAVFACVLVMTLKKLNRDAYLAFVSVSLIILTVASYYSITFVGEYLKGYRHIAEDIKQYDPEGRYPVVAYRNSAPSLSFYLDRVVMTMFGKTRETQFQTEEEIRKVYIDTKPEVVEYAKEHKEFLAVLRSGELKRLRKRTGAECIEVSRRAGDKLVVHCINKD